MYRTYIRIGAFLGALSVILGAFGAHYLKSLLGEDAVKSFHTGVEYQFYHSLAIILTGLLMLFKETKGLFLAAKMFIAGVILFSGSLYVLTLLKATGDVGLKSIGLITPIGGLLFIAGWIGLFFGVAGPTHKDGDKSL